MRRFRRGPGVREIHERTLLSCPRLQRDNGESYPTYWGHGLNPGLPRRSLLGFKDADPLVDVFWYKSIDEPGRLVLGRLPLTECNTGVSLIPRVTYLVTALETC